MHRFFFDFFRFRLLSNSSVMYFNNSEWTTLSGSFCIDGIQNYGMSLFYTGSLWDQVLRVCPNGIRQTTSPAGDERRVVDVRTRQYVLNTNYVQIYLQELDSFAYSVIRSEFRLRMDS